MDCVQELYADKDLSLLKKLTLIIPTYNRNFYLSRCLWYHAHFPFGQIIVADSSSEKKKIVNRITVEKIRSIFGVNILYLEYEPETEPYGGDIYRKWNDAVQHVQTPFSQFCTDKEFLIPTALTRCIFFLEKNLDYVTAECVVYQLREDINAKIDFTPWQDVPSVTQESPEERLKTAWRQVTGTLFSTYRAIDHKRIYQNLVEYNINDIRYGESAIELQPLLLGKVLKWHDYPGRVRDISHLKATSILSGIDIKESSFTRYPRINEYPPDVSKRLLKNLQLCCNSISDDTKQNARSIDEILYGVFLHRYKSGIGIYDRFKIIRKLWDKIPLTLQRPFKKMIGRGDIVFSDVELGYEVVMITQIVRDTRRWYQNDEPISFSCLD